MRQQHSGPQSPVVQLDPSFGEHPLQVSLVRNDHVHDLVGVLDSDSQVSRLVLLQVVDLHVHRNGGYQSGRDLDLVVHRAGQRRLNDAGRAHLDLKGGGETCIIGALFCCPYPRPYIDIDLGRDHWKGGLNDGQDLPEDTARLRVTDRRQLGQDLLGEGIRSESWN